MNNKANKFFGFIAAGVFAIVLAGSAQAQWTVQGKPRVDNQGRTIGLTEKHRNGSVRMMNRQYHAGSNAIMTERVTTFGPGGDINTIVFERRDKLDRVTFQSNEFKNNRGVWQKFRQNIRYRDDRDTTGIRSAERWNPTSGRWERA